LLGVLLEGQPRLAASNPPHPPTCTSTHSNTCTCTQYTHTQHTHTHTHARMHTHTHPHPHTYANARTRTHTRTQVTPLASNVARIPYPIPPAGTDPLTWRPEEVPPPLGFAMPFDGLSTLVMEEQPQVRGLRVEVVSHGFWFESWSSERHYLPTHCVHRHTLEACSMHACIDTRYARTQKYTHTRMHTHTHKHTHTHAHTHTHTPTHVPTHTHTPLH